MINTKITTKFVSDMRTRILALALSAMGIFASAQSDLSNFTMASLNYKFHPKFYAFAELQARSVADFSTPDYYEVKGGVGYYLTPNHMPFVGVGRYVNYKDNAWAKEEFRIWVQDIINLKAGVFKFENRFRAEKGWFNEPSGKKSDRIRLRYRLNVSAPLNGKKIEEGTFFANAFSETFYTFSENDPVFSRNRVYGGLGYQVSKEMALVTGYLWQREFAFKGNKNIHFVYLGFTFNIDGTK